MLGENPFAFCGLNDLEGIELRQPFRGSGIRVNRFGFRSNLNLKPVNAYEFSTKGGKFDEKANEC